MERRINNVKIINHDSTIENSDLIIKNNTILKIIPKSGAFEKIIIPSFTDIHYHYKIYNDSFPENEFNKETIKKMLKKLFIEGTTEILITSLAWQLEDVERFVYKFVNYIKNSNTSKDEAKIIGINLEGPFVSLQKLGMQYKKNILPINKLTLDKLEKILQIGDGFIKIMTIAPEIAGASKLISLLEKYNVVISLGHSNASTIEANNAFSKNVSLVTHLWNAMSGVSHHAPGGSVLSSLANKDVNVEFISRGHSKEIRQITFETKGPNKIILVSDYGEVERFGDADYYTMGENLKILNNKVVNLKNQISVKDYFSKFNDNKIPMISNIKKMKNIVKNFEDIVKMSSYNALNLLGIEKGKIREGYNEGFCLLNKDFSLIKVF